MKSHHIRILFDIQTWCLWETLFREPKFVMFEYLQFEWFEGFTLSYDPHYYSRDKKGFRCCHDVLMYTLFYKKGREASMFSLLNFHLEFNCLLSWSLGVPFLMYEKGKNNEVSYTSSIWSYFGIMIFFAYSCDLCDRIGGRWIGERLVKILIIVVHTNYAYSKLIKSTVW